MNGEAMNFSVGRKWFCIGGFGSAGTELRVTIKRISYEFSVTE
jgi:hypothetical protein